MQGDPTVSSPYPSGPGGRDACFHAGLPRMGSRCCLLTQRTERERQGPSSLLAKRRDQKTFGKVRLSTEHAGGAACEVVPTGTRLVARGGGGSVVTSALAPFGTSGAGLRQCTTPCLRHQRLPP